MSSKFGRCKTIWFPLFVLSAASACDPESSQVSVDAGAEGRDAPGPLSYEDGAATVIGDAAEEISVVLPDARVHDAGADSPRDGSGDIDASCTSHPCKEPGRTVCTVETSGATTCSCDADRVDDGWGRCMRPARFGMNLERVGDSALAWTFTDVFRSSRQFTSVTTGGAADSRPLDLDADGWVRSLLPGQAAATGVLSLQGNNWPASDWVLLYDGSGTLLVQGDGVVTANAPGRIDVRVTPSATLRTGIRLTATDPTNPVRNIRFLPSQYATGVSYPTFRPEFLGKLSGVEVIRFLNWTRSNDSPVVAASDRTPLSAQTQDSLWGVAPELIAELSNTVGADPWINIPHLASDDWVLQYAQALRKALDPSRVVYVEHSNEIWGTFSQSAYAQTEGVRLGLSQDPKVAAFRWHADRSLRIWSIFETVFGGTGNLVRVMGAAHFNASSLSEALDWNEAWRRTDAVATAPYIGGRLGAPALAPTTLAQSIPELVSAMDAESVIADGMTKANRAIATSHRVHYFAYEGGQALYGQGAYATNAALGDLFARANRDPAMRKLYRDHLGRWSTSGGELFNMFNFISRYNVSGCWGLLETQTQSTQVSYKYLGVLDWLSSQP